MTKNIKKTNNTKNIKKTKITKPIIEKKQDGECYTFLENVSIWLDIYGIGERVLLTKEDMKVYWPFVVLTSEYRWKSIIAKTPKKKGCWC